MFRSPVHFGKLAGDHRLALRSLLLPNQPPLAGCAPPLVGREYWLLAAQLDATASARVCLSRTHAKGTPLVALGDLAAGSTGDQITWASSALTHFQDRGEKADRLADRAVREKAGEAPALGRR